MRTFVLVLLAGCSHHDEPPPAPGSAEPPVAAAPIQKQSVDYGTCEVLGEKVTPTVRVVQSKYWDMDTPGPPLSVNCIGKEARLSFAASPGVNVPFGPHTYKIDNGRGDVVVMARVKDKQLAAVTGTIDVTVFDEHHLTGTFDLNGTGAGAKVPLTGSFDFRK